MRPVFADCTVLDEVSWRGGSLVARGEQKMYNSHAVSILNSRQSVGNGNGRPTPSCLIQSILYHLLGRRVERRSGLVGGQLVREQAKRRTPQCIPRPTEALWGCGAMHEQWQCVLSGHVVS